MKQAQAIELVGRDFAGAERRGLAEEISLEKGVAERARFEQIVVGFDFFGEQAHAVAGIVFRAMAIGDGGAHRRIAGAEVDLEKFHEREQRLPLGVAGVVVERERVAFIAKLGAELDDFLRRRDGFEDFDDDLVGRKQPSGAALEREEIEIDERFGVAGERFAGRRAWWSRR